MKCFLLILKRIPQQTKKRNEMEKMKAAFCNQYGPPGVIQIKETEKPVPKDHEILVKVHATSVTAADSRVRGFRVPVSAWLPARLVLGIRKPKHPILGSELAGVVESAGNNVNKFKPGDAVFASTIDGHTFGAYAEYKCLPENGIVALKPNNMTFEEAATIPTGARTALHFLRKAKIKKGQKVLIYGASGSVGTFAVQLAKYYGARVTAVCSRKNIELVKSLGADEVIDYASNNFRNYRTKFDVVFETVGKISFARCLQLLKKDGILLHAVAELGISLRMLIASIGSKRRFIGGSIPKDPADMELLKNLIEQKKLKTVVKRVYAFNQIVEAHRHVDKGHKIGNVAVKIVNNNQ